MAICKNCGVEVADEKELCPACNTEPASEPPETELEEELQYDILDENEPVPALGSHKLKVGTLVWSIINTVIGALNTVLLITILVFPPLAFPTLGLPFGILGIVLTNRAKKSPTASNERKSLKTARILNAISTALLVLKIVLVVIFAVIFIAVLGVAGFFTLFEVDLKFRF